MVLERNNDLNLDPFPEMPQLQRTQARQFPLPPNNENIVRGRADEAANYRPRNIENFRPRAVANNVPGQPQRPPQGDQMDVDGGRRRRKSRKTKKSRKTRKSRKSRRRHRR